MKCPCINCICVPVCRHKTFDNLYDDCILLEDYSYDNDLLTPPIYRIEINSILKPTTWSVDVKGYLNLPA